MAVELIYVGECKFPGSSGLVKLASPAFDVPLRMRAGISISRPITGMMRLKVRCAAVWARGR